MSDLRGYCSVLSYLLFVLGSYFSDGGWMQNKLAFGSTTIHACTSLFLLVIVRQSTLEVSR